MIKLYPHQIEALSWLDDKPKAMLALDAGLGKSAIAIKTFLPHENILIICPATLKINWKNEILKWCNFPPMINLIENRKQSLKPGINIVNYDIIGRRVGKGRSKKVEPCFDFKNFHIDRVVLDESHYIKNAQAVRTKIAAKLVKLTDKALLLTGTPGERPIDLYVPLFAMGATDLSKHDYGIMFCDARKIYLGNREVWRYDGNSDPELLKKWISTHTLIQHKEDVIDLPEKIFNVIELDLPISQQEKEYNFNDIIDDPRPIGFEGLSELLHEQGIEKVPLAINHIKMRLETTKKMVIFCKHIDVLDMLFTALGEFNPVKLDGRDTAKKKDEAVKRFQTDEDCRVFIGQIKAAGVGITLTAASDVVFVENNWSYSDLSQASDRCHRIGQKRNVYVEILTISDSIDHKVLYKTLEKKKFIEEVL